VVKIFEVGKYFSKFLKVSADRGLLIFIPMDTETHVSYLSTTHCANLISPLFVVLLTKTRKLYVVEVFRFAIKALSLVQNFFLFLKHP